MSKYKVEPQKLIQKGFLTDFGSICHVISSILKFYSILTSGKG